MSLTAGLFLALLFVPGAQAPAQAKPGIRVASDGFPTGHDTPEGAAADLARAFIARDAALFRRSCVRAYGPAEYPRLLGEVVKSMEQEAARPTPSPGGPKRLDKVFAARHLSRSGPASYGYAAFGFLDVMFVDVGVFLHDGGRALNRTMVIKDKDGSWYVHPAPAVSPLLSMGLNDESPSRQDFSQVYKVTK